MELIDHRKREKDKMKKVFATLALILAVVFVLCVMVGYGARLYFMMPVKDYYQASEQVFVIPGINSGFIPQGISYDERTDSFFITGYMNDGSASPIYVKPNYKTSTATMIRMADENGNPYHGHCGGLSVHGDYVYVAGGNGVYVYDYTSIVNAANGSSVNALGHFDAANGDGMGVAFTCVAERGLILGEFYREENYQTPKTHHLTSPAGDQQTAIAFEYAFSDADDAVFGLHPTPVRAYSMPGLVQGMEISGSTMYLSTSYGVAFSHILKYDMQKMSMETHTFEGLTIPLYYADSAALVKDMMIAPMSEEIVLHDGKMYVMYESASNKYIFGKLLSAQWCYATQME